MRNHLATLAILAATTSTVMDAAPLPEKKSPAGIEVKLRDAKDSYTIRRAERDVTLEILSPKGISRAVVKRTGERWPETLIVRLRLSHLEFLEIHHGKTAVSASVGWTDKAGLRMRQWSLGNERAVLNAGHPLFLPIRLLDREGKPATRPAEDGWFEIPLPSALFEGNPEAFTIDWIDAYRN